MWAVRKTTDLEMTYLEKLKVSSIFAVWLDAGRFWVICLFSLSFLGGSQGLSRLPSRVWTLDPTFKHTFYPDFTTMPKYCHALALSIAKQKPYGALCVLRNLAKDVETRDCHRTSSHPAWPLLTRGSWHLSCGAPGRCLQQGTNSCSVPELVLPSGAAQGPSPYCPVLRPMRRTEMNVSSTPLFECAYYCQLSFFFSYYFWC